MPPVSSLSCAENEVRFPVRLAKNRTSSVVHWQFNVFTSSLLRFLLPGLLGNTNREFFPTRFCESGWTHFERIEH